MISTSIRRLGAALCMLATLAFSGEVLATQHTTKRATQYTLQRQAVKNWQAVKKSILAIV